jgi:hypothetical protein
MRLIHPLTIAFATLFTFPALAAEENGLPIQKVEIFSSGVGYFEHFGAVEGDGSLELRFKTNQINDVLKSLVLQDLDGGKISNVVYPSKDPVSKILQSFEVDLSDQPSLPDLLSRLQGEQIKVKSGGAEMEGTILGVERRKVQLGESEEPIEIWVLSLLTGGTIRSLEQDKIEFIELHDENLKAELAEALATIAETRGSDTKPVNLNFSGEGQRRVRVGYLVETPIWKTSYRLIMPEEKEGEAYLQGWAIVENQTDNDWNGVDLSLISGRPISFIQDLYRPLYLPRPVVKPDLQASLRPQTYEGGMEVLEREDIALGEEVQPSEGLAYSPSTPELRQRSMGLADSMPQRAMAKSLAPASEPEFAYDSFAGELSAEQLRESVASAAAAGDVGELFRYTVAGVNLPRQRSAMIPIVTENIQAERVSIYNQSAHDKHPLNGARMTNTTGNHLLAGPVTVLDGGAYAGDAQIGNLPPGQERLLSYAMDLEVLVDPTKNREESTIQTGKIVKGVLELTRKQVATREYRIANKATEDKVLVVEHPIRQGWNLKDTPEPIETTDTLYRFRVPVSASSTTLLPVKEETIQGQALHIFSMDVGTLEFYTKSGEISANVRRALQSLVERKNALVEVEREMAERRMKLQEITTEQERIRQNLASVQNQQASAYYGRLIAKLDEQETEIEKLQGEIAELETALKDRRKALEDELGNLNVD